MADLLQALDVRYVLTGDELAKDAADRIRELEAFIEAEGRCLLAPESDSAPRNQE